MFGSPFFVSKHMEENNLPELLNLNIPDHLKADIKDSAFSNNAIAEQYLEDSILKNRKITKHILLNTGKTFNGYSIIKEQLMSDPFSILHNIGYSIYRKY